MLQYSCLENPHSDREAWQAIVYRVAKSQTGPKRPCMHKHKTCIFFACGNSVPVRVEHEGGAAVWLSVSLVAPSVQGHRLPLQQVSWPYQSLFFQASCSWWSEDLFGYSFSIALPIQALRGFPCLGSFSVVRCIRHIEGPPGWSPTRRSALQSLKGATWVGSYSVVQCIRCLMDQPLYCSAADAGVWGRERLWWWLQPLCVIHQYHLASMAAWLSSTGVSTIISSLTSPRSISLQSTPALALALLHNP